MTPVDRQLAAEPGMGLGRPAAAGVQAALAVPDHQLRQRADRPHAGAHAPEHVRRLLAEDQPTRTPARVAQTRDDDPRPPHLPTADRDQPGWLPQIPLADLPRPIDSPLMRPQPQKHRPHLAQIVIDYRLAAVEPERLDQLPNTHPGQPRVPPQQPVDLILERVELRRPLWTPNPGRHIRAQRWPGSCCAPIPSGAPTR